MISAEARPKVNLFLHVTGRREDGYHLLESLVVFPEGGDRITVKESETLSLSLSGPFSKIVGSNQDNLVLKAARLLKSEGRVSEGAEITLEKNLPVAAGIGGGSADAAATLKLLNKLWNLNFSDESLSEIGLTLGADVPACLHGKPAIMSGIGEKIVGLSNFPKLSILLVNPGYEVATKEVFKRLKIEENSSEKDEFNTIDAQGMLAKLAELRNDLEPPALAIAPEITTVLSVINEQEGCRLARMSGSGATCFGLFEKDVAAHTAAKAIRSYYPDWWVQAADVHA